MSKISVWLIYYDFQLYGIPYRKFHQQSRLRHLMWPLLRLRLQLFWLEFKFNRNWKVARSPPWLKIDLRATPYLNNNETKEYFAHLARLRERTYQQEDFDVSTYCRASRGWLWFSQPPQSEEYSLWPRYDHIP